MNNFKENEFLDVEAPILDDINPGGLIKVYPYEIINSDKEKAFIHPNCVSIVSISQSAFANNDAAFHNMDSSGPEFFFELLASMSVDGKLDIATATSVFGQKLSYEHSFTGITDQFYDHKHVKPLVFTFGEPFSREKYENDEQQVFIATSLMPAGGYGLQSDLESLDMSINQETLTEIQFTNIKDIEATLQNSRVLFTKSIDFNKDIHTEKNKEGITIGLENHLLLSSITGKGEIKQVDDAGNTIQKEFGDIDFISSEKWVPIKMTPTSVNEKTTMFVDWFDYDSVMPFVFATKFASGADLSSVVGNADDLKMIEDMLAISAGFAENWKKAPVLTTGSDAGKIDPNYRVGHQGIKITTIANSDPIKVVDGIYESHIREHPAFLADKSRYQPAKQVINALSRYIYSSYAIGKGLSSFNQVYLPWYLEPSATTPIRFGKSETVPNPDYGSTGDVTTYVLNDGIKFQSKTVYFNDNFTHAIPKTGTDTITLPSSVNISNQILLQTDRKLTLPELPENITAISKLPLPGDVDTKSERDLQYIWMLPIQNQLLFEELMLNTVSTVTPTPVGTDVTVNIPTTQYGDDWTQAQANAWVLAKQPGTLKTPPVLKHIEHSLSTGHTIKTRTGRGGTEIIVDGHSLSGLSGLGAFDTDVPLHTFNYILAQFGIHDHGEKYFLIDTNGNKLEQGNSGVLGGTFRLVTYYTEFTPAVVTTTTALNLPTYSLSGRQLLFDKQQWEKFITGFGVIPNGTNRYNFSTVENFKVESIDELVIKSMWGNNIELIFGPGADDYFKVPLFNKDDETITTQRFLFI